MTTTAFDDQYLAEPEPVRQPYDTGSILRRNVVDLEIALKQQAERAGAAEAELAKLAKQEPVAYVKYKATGGNVGLAWMAIPTAAFYPREGEKLYVTPVPAPAVPSVVFMAHNKTSNILFAARKDADQYAAAAGPAAGVSVTECAVIGSQSAPQAPAVPQNELVAAITVYLKADDEMHQATRRTGFGGMGKPVASEAEQRRLAAIRHAARGDLEALLQSAPQAPAVPELDPMTRLIVSDPKQIKPKKQEPAVPEFCAIEAQLTLAETEMLNAKAWSPGTQAKRHIDFAMTAICCASALLQSAEVTK